MSTLLDEAFQPTPVADEADNARRAVSVDNGDLRSELTRLPSDLAHYGFELARAQRRWLLAKINLKEVESAVGLEVRETLLDLGEKVTEKTVEAKVQVSAAVRAANAQLIEAEFERDQLRAVTDSLRAKRENLTSLVMLAKAEMGGYAWSGAADGEEAPRG